MSFWRRPKYVEPEPLPLTLWIWPYDTTGRFETFVTRFFFTEFLDLPDTIGQDLHRLVTPFDYIAEIVGVRPHATYIAVEWRVGESSGNEELLAYIIQTMIVTLGERFNWSQMPKLEYLNNQRDLELLRERVKVPSDGAYAHYRWRIGMG